MTKNKQTNYYVNVSKLPTTRFKGKLTVGSTSEQPESGQDCNHYCHNAYIPEYRICCRVCRKPIEDKKEGIKGFEEVLNRMKYFYLQLDGTMNFPNSAEGDLLKMVYEILRCK